MKPELEVEEFKRYGRQMIIPSFGKGGQLRLKSSKVVIIGIGGLGCPSVAYLAGAGIGRIGLVDQDVVDLSNCHRQILHGKSSEGGFKVDSAASYIENLNSNVQVDKYRVKLSPENVEAILSTYDLVLDCTDNQDTRYLISDACVLLGIPLVSGSALKTDGQIAVLNYKDGPCYRCLFPVASPDEMVQSCGEAGILGPVVGLIGVLQALEAIKLLVRDAKPITSTDSISKTTYRPTLTLFSASDDVPWRTIKLRSRKVECVSCGKNSTITFETLKREYASTQVRTALCEVNNTTTLCNNYRIDAPQLATFGGTIIDIRDATQYAIASIPGSQNVPLETLSNYHIHDDADIILVCRHGIDSQKAAMTLISRFPRADIKDLRGGLSAYAQFDETFPVY